MVVRVEKKTLTVTPTHDPNIVRINADVTMDAHGKKSPAMEHVEIMWNINTDITTIKNEMRKKIKGTELQEKIRAAIGEDIIEVV